MLSLLLDAVCYGRPSVARHFLICIVVFIFLLCSLFLSNVRGLRSGPSPKVEIAHTKPSLASSNDTIHLLMPKCKGYSLEDITIDQIQQFYHARSLSVTDVASCYLKRIWQTNEYVNSVTQINPDIMEIAAQLDHERESGRDVGPLHGVPVLTKDNIATKDQMDTTAGSYMLVGTIVPRDAFIIAKLREAGALILGHASCTEWASMRSSNMSEGYSGRQGQVRSPYNLTCSPGGSSSGSAAGLATNQAVFALGTETDGSIIGPASRNALVGIKPTVGLLSRAGIIPDSHHQDTPGTMARTVRDAVYALDAVYGPDPRDKITLLQKSVDGGYSRFLTDQKALKGARFGIPWDSFWALNSPEQNAVLVDLIDMLKDAGATIVNNTELPNLKQVVYPKGWDWDWKSKLGLANESEFTVVKVDFYNDIKAYLAELDNNVIHGVEDIIAYNLDSMGAEGGRPGINPGFGGGQDQFYESLASKGFEDDVYKQALAYTRRSSREEGIDAIFANSIAPLDALLAPADVGQVWSIPAQAGYPLVTIPAGVNNSRTGMPFGLTLMGMAWSEPMLIRFASAIEDLQLSKGIGRTKPLWKDWRRRVLPIVSE